MLKISNPSKLQEAVVTVETSLKEYDALKQECVDLLGYDPTTLSEEGDDLSEGATKSAPNNDSAKLMPNTHTKPKDKMTQQQRQNEAQSPINLVDDDDEEEEELQQVKVRNNTDEHGDDEMDDIPLAKRQKVLVQQRQQRRRQPTPDESSGDSDIEIQDDEEVIEILSTDSDEEREVAEQPQRQQQVNNNKDTRRQSGTATEWKLAKRMLPKYQPTDVSPSAAVAANTRGGHQQLPAYTTKAAGHTFTHQEAARQFRTQFKPAGSSKFNGQCSTIPGSKKARLPLGMSKRSVEINAKKILLDLTAKSPTEMKKTKNAWLSAAMAWRTQNMPSGSEIDALKAVEKERIAASQAKRMASTKEKEAAAAKAHGQDAQQQQQGRSARSRAGNAASQKPPPKYPGVDSSEADKRAYYRQIAALKAEKAPAFEQLLKAFKVPCDRGKIKEAWRVAVRMYHPDSNSKDRVWSNDEQKMECEEVMKLLNEKRPPDL